MIEVAVLGAGGKMGGRIARSLQGNSSYNVRYVEPSDAGRARIAELGLQATGLDAALSGAEIVIFAVPDRVAKAVTAEVVPKLDPGTSMLFLDPAAIAAGRVPRRDDVNCYVMHPTHPPLYSLLSETDPDARKDYWGGGLAVQSMVFAVAWGDDGEIADRVDEFAQVVFAPIGRSHRISVAQMAMLEPALTETLTNGCVALIREGMERVIAAGVPEAATKDFLMGHLQIGIALIFGELDWKLSDGAVMALERSKASLFKDDWYRIFEPAELLESVRAITGGD